MCGHYVHILAPEMLSNGISEACVRSLEWIRALVLVARFEPREEKTLEARIHRQNDSKN